MKKIILPFILILTFSAPLAAQSAPAKAATSTVKSQLTAKTVIDNYFTALGGKQKLEAVKSAIIENSMSAEGIEITMTTKRAGNKFNSVQSVMGNEISQVFNGEKGFVNQMGKKSDFTADKIANMKKSKTLEALSYDPNNFSSVTSEQIDGKSYNVLTSDKGKFSFDATTGLLYKSVTPDATTYIKNYMTVDGIKFPEQVDVEGKRKVTIKTTKVTLNSGVSDADFKI